MSALAGVALLVSREADAAPSARLVYLRSAEAESCPDEASIRAAVAARLGYDPFFPAARATMFVELAVEKGSYVARIKLVDENNTVRGKRQLWHKSTRCHEIVDAVALSMSIAIDPDSLGRDPQKVSDEAAPAVALEPERPTTSMAASERAPERAAPPRASTPDEPIHLRGALAGGAWAGIAPDVNPYFAAGVAVRRGTWSMAVEGRLDLQVAKPAAGGEVWSSFAGGSLVPCFTTGGTVELQACIEGTLGILRAGSRDVSLPGSDSAALAWVGPRLGGGLRITDRLMLTAAATLGFSLGTKTFRLGADAVHTTSALVGGAGVGVAGDFL